MRPLFCRPSARASVAAVAQRNQSASVGDERAKALAPPPQRPTVAMEIEKNEVVFLGRYVPDDHLRTVGGVQYHFFRFRQANGPRSRARALESIGATAAPGKAARQTRRRGRAWRLAIPTSLSLQAELGATSGTEIISFSLKMLGPASGPLWMKRALFGKVGFQGRHVAQITAELSA